MNASRSSSASRPEGFALVCSTAGAVQRVVRSSIDGAPIASSFTTSVGESSRDACTLFLRGVSRGGFARSTPLRIGTRDVHCFGFCSHEVVRIAGVIDPRDAATYADAVATEEQDPGFSELAREIRLAHSTYELYEELARANNELVTAQRELARTVAELERLNVWKSEVLGVAAHDLRNPLAVNAGLIAFLQHDAANLSPNNRQLVDRLRANSEYMLRLVDSVLDFSAIESGQVRLVREEVSLDAIVGGVVATMRILAEAKRMRIDYKAEEMPPVSVDRIRLMEALHNVIGNAVQYSPSGSLIEVRLRRDRDEALIEVEDHGPGIPESELPDIFVPFKRLSTARAGRQRSVGLGLAITRRLIEEHGGTLSVKTEMGRGSTFAIRLPIG